MLKRLLFILISLAGLTSLARTPRIVPAPAEYQAHKGYFKTADTPANVFISHGSEINRSLTSDWLRDAGIDNNLYSDSATAGIHLLLSTGITGNPEGYSLEITPRNITLSADSDKGLIWGLQTLRQLYNSEGRLQSCRIVDYPLYPWRS